MPWLRAEAGSRPGGRDTFLCFAKEKYPKERRPPVCDPFAERRGKPASCRLRGAPWNSLCAARAARTATASQFTKHGRFDAHAHPTTAPPQAQPAGVGQPNIQTAGHPFGPSLRSAQFAQRVALAPASWGRAQRSEAKARVDVWFPLPLWMRRGAQGLADQGSRLSERSEFERDPAKPEHRRLPRSEAQGTKTVGSPFLWFLSFGDAKERDSPAGRLPASALEKGMWPNESTQHQTLQNQ